jgi:hypothetical protein
VRHMKYFLALLCSIFLIQPVLAETTVSAELRTTTLEHGRTLAAAFFAAKLEGIWEATSDGGKAQFGNMDGLKAYRSDQNALGNETKLIKEEVGIDGDTVYYTRTVRLENAQNDYQLWIGFDNVGKITSLILKPAGDQSDGGSGNKG